MTPHRLPTPPEIAQDPERAVLAALDVTLEMAENALIAAHPELCDDDFPHRANEAARRADDFLELARKVHSTLASYRLAQLRDRDANKKPELEDIDPPF